METSVLSALFGQPLRERWEANRWANRGYLGSTVQVARHVSAAHVSNVFTDRQKMKKKNASTEWMLTGVPDGLACL